MVSFIIIIMVFILLITAWVKNEITYSIQIKLVDEVYENRTKGDKTLDWSDIPDYNKMFMNPFIWKYKSLQKRLKQTKQNKD